MAEAGGRAQGAGGWSLTPAQARALDARAERNGYPVLLLMENAGRGAAVIATEMLAEAPARSRARGRLEVLVLAGPGNNGGDALVVARHLHVSGYRVRCVLAAGAGNRACRTMLARARRAGVRIMLVAGERRVAGSRGVAGGRTGAGGVARALRGLKGWPPLLVVDGLFGTGLSRPLGGAARELAVLVNGLRDAGRTRVLALDVPSGMDALRGGVVGDGQEDGSALRADVTATFAAPKAGMRTRAGRALCGEVRVVLLGLPAGVVRPGLRRGTEGTGERGG